ncbi:MAG: hypothetical protein AB9866_23070 [Syntrophobacteraceae bacterium]
MATIFFSTAFDKVSLKILKSVGEAIHPEPLMVYHDIEAFAERLWQPISEHDIAVVYLSTRRELLNLIKLGERLIDLQTILILPDSKEDTLEKAHLIRPRFLTYPESAPSAIAAVLAKMLTAQASHHRDAKRNTQQPDIKPITAWTMDARSRE